MFSICCTVALNHKNIAKDLQRISKIKLFIDQYNWKEVSFPSNKEDWKKFETNNKTIALNTIAVRTCI